MIHYYYVHCYTHIYILPFKYVFCHINTSKLRSSLFECGKREKRQCFHLMRTWPQLDFTAEFDPDRISDAILTSVLGFSYIALLRFV